MRQQKQRASGALLLALTFLLAACTAAAPSAPATSPPQQTVAPPPETAVEEKAVEPTGEPVIEAPEAAVTEAAPPENTAADNTSGRPDWQTIGLTDARTGEAFALSDFTGKVIIVETMAVWCPLCDQQQLQIKSALDGLGEDVVVVSLDVDPGETADIVARHANDLDLPWRFAVAGSKLSAMLQNEFGPQVLAPPSTPVLIIAPDGSSVLTPFGIKGWDTLVEMVQPLLP